MFHRKTIWRQGYQLGGSCTKPVEIMKAQLNASRGNEERPSGYLKGLSNQFANRSDMGVAGQKKVEDDSEGLA